MNTFIKTDHGVIEGRLRDAPSTKRLLVISHGFKSSHEHPALKAIADGLHKKGHAVFTFNFSPDKSGMNMPQQIADIKAILNYFTGRDIVLLGGSFGALMSAMATQDEPRVTGLITLNGFFGGAQLGKNTRWIFLGLRTIALVRPKYRAIWRFFKTTFRPERIACPVLVMHSQSDKHVQIIQSRRFYTALTGGKTWVELVHSDHNLTHADELIAVIDTINAWVAELQLH